MGQSANNAPISNQLAAEEEARVERTESSEEEEERLRYLEFVQQAAAQALVLSAAAYARVRQAGLRPGVDHVEGTVKAVVGPVYDRFHAVPLDLLKFLDRKSWEDLLEGSTWRLCLSRESARGNTPPNRNELTPQVGESVQELDRRVPPVVKEAPTVARSAAAEVRQTGVVGTATDLARSAMARAELKARDLYNRYEPVAERTAAEAWSALNRLPLVPSVTRALLPTAAQLSARYNSAVRDGAKRGNTVATYLPLVPTERPAKVLGYPPADSGSGSGPAPAAAPEMQPIPSQ